MIGALYLPCLHDPGEITFDPRDSFLNLASIGLNLSLARITEKPETPSLPFEMGP